MRNPQRGGRGSEIFSGWGKFSVEIPGREENEVPIFFQKLDRGGGKK
jgi:hypothetical protein